MNRSAALAAGLIACFGTAVGHGIAYVAVHPDVGERAALLDATGHGYWPVFLSIAFAALVAGLLAGVLWGFRRETAPGFAVTALALGLVQSLSFVGLETAERVFAEHAGSGSLPAVLALGIALQFGCALAGAWVLRWSYRLGEKYRAAVTTSRGAPALRPLFIVGSASRIVTACVRVSSDARAPPSTGWSFTSPIERSSDAQMYRGIRRAVGIGQRSRDRARSRHDPTNRGTCGVLL